MYYSIILFFVCETNCFLIYFYELKKKNGKGKSGFYKYNKFYKYK